MRLAQERHSHGVQPWSQFPEIGPFYEGVNYGKKVLLQPTPDDFLFSLWRDVTSLRRDVTTLWRDVYLNCGANLNFCPRPS